MQYKIVYINRLLAVEFALQVTLYVLVFKCKNITLGTSDSAS